MRDSIDDLPIGGYLADLRGLSLGIPAEIRRALGGVPDPILMRALARESRYDGRFHNVTEGLRPRAPDASLFREFRDGKRIPGRRLPVLRPTREELDQRGELAVRWLGHSCTLVEVDGIRLLTDPVFQSRIGPAPSLGGAPRFHDPPVHVEELASVDAVVLSHDHYDHLDVDVVTELGRLGARFITPLGVGAHLRAWGIPSAAVTELDWWGETRVGPVRVVATPAMHFSGRGPADRNRTLWASFAFVGEAGRVFFSGDTGYHERFAEIRARLGPFDLAMFEVGAFHPTWANIHLGPDNALRAHGDLGARVFLPIHWGTYPLAPHDWWEPAERVHELFVASGADFASPRVGERFEVHGPHPKDPWWRPFVV